MTAAAADRVPGPVQEWLASPRLSAATTTAALALGVFATAIERTAGLATLVAALVTLTLLVLASALARRREIEWYGLLPVSLLLFIGWAAVSIIWSEYRWATVGGLAYLVAFTVLGVSIALTRDLIQIVRALGDVLRVALALSLGIEIFAGVIIDTPLPFLGVQGNIAQLGPIQGIMGTRNQFALLATIALITFAVEFATNSVSRGLAIGSIVLGSVCVLLSRSPIVAAVGVVVVIAVAALLLIRRAPPEQRTFWQLVVVGFAVIAAIVTWLLRARIIEFFAANSELTYRVGVWQRVWALTRTNLLEGWGWIGEWQADVPPFPYMSGVGGRETTTALNAYLDVWFQLGLVGFFIFLVLVGLTFTRSWLLAGRQRNVLQVWPALILVALVVTSLAESSMLREYGWMLFVVCTVKAAQQLSWRSAFTPPPEPASV